MEKYSTFIFDSYAFDPKAGKIELNYSLDDAVHFTETILLPSQPQSQIPSPESLFALHLIGGISYFKTCLPKAIEVRSGTLNAEQTKFWNTVYEKGLGEFFYMNKIDFRGLIDFPHDDDSGKEDLSPLITDRSARVLVPIGGGKDSIVTAQLLKEAGHDVTLMRIGAHPLIDAEIHVLGLPLITVERHLSPALFKLNAEGALNGHVPITAYLSFLSVVMAELYGFQTIVMSNERSANEGNVEYLGTQINHQWSKSLEAERMLQEYIGKQIDPGLRFFSLLRPLSELSIAAIFAKYPQYYRCVTSCNANWKIIKDQDAARWCGKCPKCAFAFAILSAYIAKKDLIAIFGGDLFSDPSLLPLFKQILGIEGFKPFECVGTPEETAAAFVLVHRRGEFENTPAMQLFLREVLPALKDPDGLIEEALTPSSDHLIPPSFSKLIAHSS